jgi:Photosynthesis system II assembly factor YCF48
LRSMKYIILGLIVATVGAVLLSLYLLPKAEPAGEWRLLAQSDLMHGSRLSEVRFFDRKNGIVITSGTIGRTNDGGKSWTDVQASEEQGYYSFVFADAQNGIAVGSVNNEIPLVLRTVDAGYSWQNLNLDAGLLNKDLRITVFLDACFDSTGRLWIVGNRGVVTASLEENRLNVASVHPTTDILYGVACAQNGRIWAVGQGTVLTNDNGWQRKQFDQNYYFGKVKVIANEVWLLGGIHHNADARPDSGVLLRSSNSGDTWEDKTPKSDGLPYDIVKSDGMLWLIGTGGRIHYSKDNGDSWMSLPSPTSADLLSIYFIDQKTGWITGDRGTVLRYTIRGNAE